jgi:hypothetical protein
MTTDWKIEQLECKVSENGLSNVVYKIRWTYNVVDTINGKKYRSNKFGITNIAPPNPQSFTLYDKLTKEQVVGWIIDVLGTENVTLMTTELSNKNNLKANPTIVGLKPPFK